MKQGRRGHKSTLISLSSSLDHVSISDCTLTVAVGFCPAKCLCLATRLSRRLYTLMLTPLVIVTWASYAIIRHCVFIPPLVRRNYLQAIAFTLEVVSDEREIEMYSQ